MIAALSLMLLGTTDMAFARVEGGSQPRASGAAHREMLIEHRYLHLPVRTGAAKKRVKLSIDGRTVREFEIELAEKEPEFWVFVDLDGLTGKTLHAEVDKSEKDSRALDAIIQADDVPDSKHVYHEVNRPQFHFTSRRGWLNDPNGLVWQAGVYHLFYQHNPYGWAWGNMHWGHAESTDLVHWRERPTALYPRQFGDWCFSGSAVVDEHNSGGFQTGSQPPIVVAFTSTGRGECIAFSNDRGKTWQEYQGNPVVKHAGRDPKLVWHEPSRRWIMAVYDEADGRQGIAFHHSPDVKHWTFGSKIDGFFECPDLFELPVDGASGKKLWVLHAADGKYVLGDFDGRAFHTISGKEKRQLWYGNFYAAQSFSNTPDHRRIQIGWANGVTFPGMPFNQQMALPVELTLRTADDGPRLFAQPVPELSSLRGARREWSDLTLAPGANPLGDLKGDLFEISAEFSPGKAEAFELDLRGTSLVYDISKQELTCKGVKAPLKTEDGRVRLRVFLDRGSIEVFGNDGRVAMSIGAIPPDANRSIGVSSRGGAIKVGSLVVHELKSVWSKL
jgi:fructan beta-fructosidase